MSRSKSIVLCVTFPALVARSKRMYLAVSSRWRRRGANIQSDCSANSHAFRPIDTVTDRCMAGVLVVGEISASYSWPWRRRAAAADKQLEIASSTLHPHAPPCSCPLTQSPIRWDAHGAYGGQHACLHPHSGSRRRPPVVARRRRGVRRRPQLLRRDREDVPSSPGASPSVHAARR
jgi:hypothetical protein